ncbi:MAG TPA: alpha/beta hydrolase [Acidobacteriota bacterium]|nr:alpha/beta hydrolase [Acidobacteriota bacterium]
MSFLNLSAGRIEYKWFGTDKNSDAQTLVFLHDGIGCLSLWRDFPSQVAEATECRAFVFSRFGYGCSSAIKLPRPVHFMHDEALQILPEILELAQINNPILIGHSDGGSIALIYAASKFGNNVRALIMEAPHVFVEDLTVQSIAQAGKDYRHGDLKQKLQRHHGENVDVAFWGWNQVWLNPQFRSWNIENCLPDVNCPVLVIQGEQDQFGTQKQVDAISKQCSASVQTVTFSDCKHTPHRQQPALTLDSMVRFILKVKQGRV